MAPLTKVPPGDEDYDSASDEDFNPNAQAAEAESSSSEDEVTPATSSGAKKRGTKRARDQDDLDAELASGDEATIEERRKRKKRKSKGADGGVEADFLSDDDGGEGGFVRTRAQRQTEKIERRTLASTKGATVDVDSVWNRLSALPIGREPELEPRQVENEEDYITIKRTTRFAGQLTTEEKRVLKSSKEAKIWLQEQEAAATRKKANKDKENEAPSTTEPIPDTQKQGYDAAAPDAPKIPLRRPLKKQFKWDANPTGEVKGLPPTLQLRWPRDKLAPAAEPNAAIPNHRALPKLPAAAKLNTVQKSKYDWANYVDKNKLGEELDEYGRSKESYAGRTEFLSRLEQRQEEGRLMAKSKVAAG